MKEREKRKHYDYDRKEQNNGEKAEKERQWWRKGQLITQKRIDSGYKTEKNKNNAEKTEKYEFKRLICTGLHSKVKWADLITFLLCNICEG